MRIDIIKRKEEILKWINEHKSKAYIAKEIGCKQDTLNKYLKEMDIYYLGNMAGIGLLKSKIKLEDILKNRVKFDSQQLKKRL